MVARPFTVYFDTSFYIELGKVDENLAIESIDRLNSIMIRHVLSQTVMDELLRREDTQKRDASLFYQISRFDIQPYITQPWIKWNMLLLPNDGRKILADAIRQWDELSLSAESLSGLARRGVTHENDGDMRRALKEMQHSLGLPEDPVLAAREVWSRISKLPSNIGLDFSHLKVPDVITQESAKRFAAEVASKIPDYWAKRFIEGEKVQDSSMAGDNRPYRVIVSKASEKERKRLASEFRDQRHILEFVLHRNDIDLLQVDHTQFNRIKLSTSSHRLVELGLWERCFSARRLKDVVDKVHVLQEKLEGNGFS